MEEKKNEIQVANTSINSIRIEYEDNRIETYPFSEITYGKFKLLIIQPDENSFEVNLNQVKTYAICQDIETKKKFYYPESVIPDLFPEDTDLDLIYSDYPTGSYEYYSGLVKKLEEAISSLNNDNKKLRQQIITINHKQIQAFSGNTVNINLGK